MRVRLSVYLLAIVVAVLASNYTGTVYGQTVTCMIPPGGGTCNLPGFASVIFPPGAFVTPAAFTPVTVSVTSDPETDQALKRLRNRDLERVRKLRYGLTKKDFA